MSFLFRLGVVSATNHLTLEEFHSRYANESGYEFWFGEVVRKCVPTWLHALLQVVLAEFFSRAGYAAGSELDLRIDPQWEPRPDVVAALDIEEPYPTKPVDIVAEILSPDDQFDRVAEKCRNYARIGIRQIFVLDPRAHRAWQFEDGRLEVTEILRLTNGQTIDANSIWDELEDRRRRGSKPKTSQ